MEEKEGWVFTMAKGPARVIVEGDNDDYTCFVRMNNERTLMSKTDVYPNAGVCAEKVLCQMTKRIYEARARMSLAAEELERAERIYEHVKKNMAAAASDKAAHG